MTTRKKAIQGMVAALGLAAIPRTAKALSTISEEDALIKEIGDNIESAIIKANKHSDRPLDMSKEEFAVGYPIGTTRTYPQSFCKEHGHLNTRLRGRFPEMSLVVYANFAGHSHKGLGSDDNLIVVRDGKHGGCYISDYKVKPLGDRINQILKSDACLS